MLDHFDFLVKWMPKHSYNMLCCYKQYRKSLSVIWIYEFNFFTNNEIAPLNIRVMVKQSLKLLLFSHSVMSDSLPPHELQHARLPCPSPSPGACSNLCPLSQWCHLTISSSVIPISSCLQSFPGSGSFSASGSASGIEPALLHCRPTLLPSEPPGNWD